MSAVATLRSVNPIQDNTDACQIVRGKITLSGNYVTHGDTLNLALKGVQSNQLPLSVWIYEIPVAGAAPSGYTLQYAQGTTQANGAIQVLTGGAALSTPSAELAAGAYPASLTGANIAFEAVFPHGM